MLNRKRNLIMFTLIFILNKYYVELKVQTKEIYWIADEDESSHTENVTISLYYESLCPYSINFFKNEFNSAVQLFNPYVDFQIYPYGNAQTSNESGIIMFICQHGPAECYGNKLHACAVYKLENITDAVKFISCMMGGDDHGSNDAAADRCASSLGIDANPIKTCANDEEGTQLLKYYGEESKKANFSYVPYVLINDKENTRETFLKDICSEFTVAPVPCSLFNN